MHLRLGLMTISLFAAAIAPPADGQLVAADGADALIEKIVRVADPDVDRTRRDDEQYVRSVMDAARDAAARRAALTKEFLEKHPTDPRRPAVLFVHAVSLARTDAPVDAFLDATEQFIAAAPHNPRGGDLLAHAATLQTDDGRRTALMRRAADGYPGTPGGESARNFLRRAETVGKPLDLTFTDAVSGRQISMADLKGKVVVVDFWATWCVPCVMATPHMKDLYARYKDKGVEFVGVSLDAPPEEGGLDGLKAFVAEHGITWPQYYQGNGWDSAFSRSVGVDKLPTVFVVDRDGNVYSTDAADRLDELIPALLAKGPQKAPMPR